jgi:hypothetical protein
MLRLQRAQLFMPIEDLSLIIPWCNREVLRQTLLANLPALEASRCTVVLVNCGGDPDTLVTQIPASLKRVVLVNVRRPFNKCLSINIGLAIAGTTLVSVMDADIVFSLDYLEEIANALSGRRCYTTAARVQESEVTPLTRDANRILDLRRQNYLHFRFRDGKAIKLCTHEAEPLTGARSGPGLLTAQRADLKAVGGFNSELSHWGWEDQDIQLRLMYTLGLERREVGTVQHLTHSDNARNLGSLTKEQANHINLTKCLEAYDRGNFQGTYGCDIQASYEVHSL